MISFVKSFRLFLVLATLSSVGGDFVWGVADETGATTGTTTGNTEGVRPLDLDSVLPPAFSGGDGAGNYGKIFVSCMGVQGGALGAASTALGAAQGIVANGGDLSSPESIASLPVSANSSCPPVTDLGGNDDDDKDDTSAKEQAADKLTCEDIKYGGGDGGESGFDTSIFDNLIKSVQKKSDTSKKQISALQCKKSKLEAIRGEVNCLSQQANILTQQMASLQKAYVDNIQRYQGDVGKLRGIIEDRFGQQKDVSTKLNGDKETGATGLLEMKAKTEEIVKSMPAEIDGVKQLQEQARVMRKAFEEEVQSRKMGLTTECFKDKPKSSYQCAPNGPPVTALQYVLCRYEQNQTLDAKSRIDRDKRTAAKAKGKASSLESLLNGIFGEAPTKAANIPTKPEEAVDRAVGVLDPEEIESRFGSQLAAFNGKGLDIRGFVMKEFSKCYKNAEFQVDRERKRKGTKLGFTQVKMKESEDKINTTVNELLGKYSRHWADAMRSLTGQHVPLDVSRCQQAEPDVQAGCLDDIRQNMDGLLSGAVKQAEMRIMIPGNRVPPVAVNCKGLNGCVTALQNVSRNLKSEIGRVRAFKTQYIQQANQSIERFTEQMAAQFSPASQRLADMVKAINSSMASAGVGSGMKFDPFEREELVKGKEKGKDADGKDVDEDGLYEIPKDVLKLIGGRTQPPLLNISGDSFDSALQGIAQGIKEVDEQMGKVKTKSNKADLAIPKLKGKKTNMEAKCRAEEMKKLKQEIDDLLSRLEEVGCDAYKACGKSESYESLLDSLSGIADSDSSGGGELASGLRDICGSSSTTGEDGATTCSRDVDCLTSFNSCMTDLRTSCRDKKTAATAGHPVGRFADMGAATSSPALWLQLITPAWGDDAVTACIANGTPECEAIKVACVDSCKRKVQQTSGRCGRIMRKAKDKADEMQSVGSKGGSGAGGADY